MSTRRIKLGAACALLAFAATAPFGPSAQDLPVYPAAVTCSNSSASIQQDTTLVTQVSCFETGLLRDLPADYIRTVAGNGTQGWSGDGGPATEAALNLARGVRLDLSGNIYIADWGNHLVRRVDAATGLITTVAGTGIAGSSGDDGLATQALLDQPIRVALDAANNLFIADVASGRVRRVDATTGIITTVAGGGAAGLAEGLAATEAQLIAITGIALDAAGDLFIAEIGRSRIRRVSSGADGLITRAADEIITTIAGTGVGGFSGDGGPALQAQFSLEDIDFDSQGNLFVADRLNNRVRRVSPGEDGLIRGADDEVVTTVAGGGDVTGDGILATAVLLNLPRGVAVDRFGNIFISEASALRVRRVDAVTGIISTVAGAGTALDEDIPAVTARVFNPRGLDTDAEGNLFIAELGAHRIRAVRLAPPFTYEIATFPSHGLGSLSAGGELRYQPSSDFVGDDTITFRARDAAGRTSPTATLTITVTPSPDADVAVAATVLPVSGVSADGKIAYTVTVTNHGPAEATRVVLSDVLPDGINLNYVTISSSQGACDRTLAAVTCDLGSIPNDADATVSFVVHPLSTAPKTNRASVVADQVDPNTANNTALVTSTLTSVVLTDLSVTHTDSPDPVVEGSPLTYRVTVSNAQNSCASDVIVTDTLPPRDVSLVSVTPTQGACAGLRCNLRTLCPGQSASVTIVVTPTAAGTLVNSATVQDRPSDPAVNNTATAVTKVVPSTVVINVAESVRVSDSVRLLPAALIKVSEKIVVSDTPLVVPPVVIRISEAIRVGDGVTPRPSAVIKITERVTVSDSPTVVR